MHEPLDLSHANWFKSSFSNGQGGACVEVATNLPGIVALRDSTDPDGPKLLVKRDQWRAFITGVVGEPFS